MIDGIGVLPGYFDKNAAAALRTVTASYDSSPVSSDSPSEDNRTNFRTSGHGGNAGDIGGGNVASDRRTSPSDDDGRADTTDNNPGITGGGGDSGGGGGGGSRSRSSALESPAPRTQLISPKEVLRVPKRQVGRSGACRPSEHDGAPGGSTEIAPAITLGGDHRATVIEFFVSQQLCASEDVVVHGT
jgi:hypothetical protein